jgi:hypothetical protein
MPTLRILLAVIVAISVSGRARAADDEPAVEERIKQGIALRRSGNDEAALSVFLDLEKRAPDSVRVLLHITTAAQATGKWVMAYDYLQKAASHKGDGYYQRYKVAIDNVERTISQRVGQFRARGAPAGAEVRLSGEIVGTLPMGGAKAVEVGSYVLEVAKAGYYPLRRTVTITGGGNVTQETVDLREQKAALASAAPGQLGFGGGTAADTGPTGPPPWWRARWVTWTLGTVSVAAAATAGVSLVIREMDAAKWNDDNHCLSKDVGKTGLSREQLCGPLHRDIKLAETIGIASGITAVTFGVAALVQGMSTGQGGRPVDETAHAQTKATCTPGFASVVCYGTF